MSIDISIIDFKTTFYIGQNSLEHLKSYQNDRIVIVTDSFFEKSPLLKKIIEDLSEANEIYVYADVVADPPIEVITAGVEAVKLFQGTRLLAIGGGSPIDAAKGIKFILEELNIIGDIGLTIIPTTSGSGSEATNFSIITDKQVGIKYPIVLDSLQPDEAILNSEFVLSMPRAVTADTGMDVLTHVLEAYVSSKANDFTDALCEKAISLIFEYLPIAYSDGNNKSAREKVHYASTMAGMAFNITSLGINHSLAHAAGTNYKIPHGRLNTILMPHVISFNAGLNDKKLHFCCKRYAMLAEKIGINGVNNRLMVVNLLKRIDKLRKSLDMPSKLSNFDVSNAFFQESKQTIATNAFNDPCTLTNPRMPTVSNLEKILIDAF